MKRRLNVVFLGWLIVPLIFLSIGGYLLWYFQINRSAIELINKSKKIEEEGGDIAEATAYLQKFLAYKPDDTEALTRYGFLIDKGAGNTSTRLSAVPVLERALRQLVTSAQTAKEKGKLEQLKLDNQQAVEVRRAIGEIFIEAGLVNPEFFREAQTYFDWLTEDVNIEDGADPSNPDWLLKRGMAHGSDKSSDEHYKKAIAAFDKVLKIEPDNVDASLSKAVTMRFHADQTPQEDVVAKDADDIVNEMVEAYPTAKAYLARLRYRSTYGDYKGALQDGRASLALDPENVSAMIITAILEFEQVENIDNARNLLRKAIELDPERIDAYTVLIQIEKRFGRFTAAEAVAREGIKKLGNQENSKAVELYWNLANTLIDSGDRDKAETLIANMRSQGTLGLPLLAYLDGRMLMLQKLWEEASQKIEASLAQIVQLPRVACDAQIDLATCYKQLAVKNPAKREEYSNKCISTLNSATRSNPTSVRARVSLAQAYLDENDNEDPESRLRKVEDVLSKSESSTSDILIIRARIATGVELRKSPTVRSWTHIEEMLKKVEELDPNSPQLLETWIQVYVAQGKPKSAEIRLDEVIAAHPDQVFPRVARAMVALEQGYQTEALSILEEADRELGPRPELFQGFIRYIMRRGGFQTRTALIELIPKITLYPEDRRNELMESLASALTQIRDSENSMKLWKELAKQNPDELRYQTAMFDLAFRENDQEAMESILQQIRRLEGAEGLPTLFAEAAQQISLVRKGDSKALAKAKAKLSKISRRRKNWSRVDLLYAEIAEFDKDPAAAIDHYKNAIENGERQSEVVRRTVQLLYDSQRYEEADMLIRNIESRPGSDVVIGDIKRIASDIALESKDSERAVGLARQAVSEDSTDFRDFLWLGQVYLATGQPDLAEQQFERSVLLGAEAPETWIRLAAFHFRNKNPAKSEAVLERALKALPSGIGLLAIAQCYDNLTKFEKADALYQQAMDQKPNDASIVRVVVSSWMRRGLMQNTEPLLRALINSGNLASTGSDLLWARRSLALVLSNQTGGDRFSEANQLVDSNLQINPDSDADLFAKAMVQSSRPDTRQQAIATFMKLEKVRDLEPNEAILFCRILEAENDWPQAHDRLVQLASQNKDRPDIISMLIASLLQAGDTTEARPWVERLNQIDRSSSRCAVLTSQFYRKVGDPGRALKRVQEFAQSNPDQASTVVPLLEELGDLSTAESLFQEISRKPKSPEDKFALALFYGRQGRIKEGIDLCDTLRGSVPDEQVVLVALNILTKFNIKTTSPEFQRVEKWISEIETQGNDQFDPRTLRAALLAIAGNLASARELYGQVIAARPKDFTALNNLAWILALTGKTDERSEALAYIDRAIQVIGPIPTLLDTRAIAYLAIKELDKAENDLKLAIGSQQNPVYVYHLACVQLAKNQGAVAKETFLRAKSLGFVPQLLDPLERTMYAQVAPILQKP